MKKLSFLLLLLIPAKVHAIHTIVFRNASDLSTGSVNNSLLDNSSVTKQGNGPFNGANQLVKLDGNGQTPLDGTLITNTVSGFDEGVFQAMGSTINCVGAGISCTAAGQVITINVGAQTTPVSTGATCIGLTITTSSTNQNQLVVAADYLDIMGALYVGYSTTVALNILGPGGINLGSEQPNTWYAIHAISNQAGTQAGIIVSTAFGAFQPLMPSGYTKWRPLGYVRNDASSNIVPFKKRGNQVSYFQGQNVLTAAGNQVTWTDVGLESIVSSVAANVQLSVIVGDNTSTFGKGSRIELKPKGYASDAANNASDYVGVFTTDNTAANGRQSSSMITLNLLDQRRLQYQQATTDDSTVDQILISVNGYQEDVP